VPVPFVSETIQERRPFLDVGAMAEEFSHDPVPHGVRALPLVLADARLVQRNRAEDDGRMFLVHQKVHDLHVL